MTCAEPKIKHWRGLHAYLFGADLNFDCPELRSFPGLTSPRSALERWQDPVRSDHGVRTVDELRAHRASLLGQRGVHARCRAPSRSVRWRSRN